MIISGPYNCGKTVAIEMFIHRMCILNPGLRVMVVRPTYASIKTSIISQMRDKLLKYGFNPHPNNLIERALGGSSPNEIIYKNGARIIFAGIDRDPEKILGGEFDIIFFNQVEQALEYHWQLLAGRQLEGRHGKWLKPYGKRSLLIGDCNPGPRRHWIKQRVEQDNDLEVHYVGIEHNPRYYYGDPYNYPLKEWTQEGLEYIAGAKKQFSKWMYLRYVKGYWVSPEGMVYQSWDPDIHLIDQKELEGMIDDTWKWYIAMDHGVVNAFVGQLYGGNSNQLFLYKEIYHTGLDIDGMREKLTKLKSYIPKLGSLSWITADHNKAVNLSLQVGGDIIRNADKPVLTGIEMVKNCLSNVEVRFNKTPLVHDPDPTLKNAGNPYMTIHEFDGYSYKDPSKMDGSEKDEYPQKGFDHGMDALRYQLMEWKDTSESFTGVLDIIEPNRPSGWF